MKSIDSKYQLLKNLHFYSIVLLCVSIPLSIRLNSYLLVASCCIAFAHFVLYQKKKIEVFLNAYFWVFAALYLLHFIGFTNSEEFKPVWFDLEQKLPLLVIPLIFIWGPAQGRKEITLLLKIFVLTILLVCLYSFRNGFYLGYETDEFYDYLLVQRPYLGMYCIASIFFCIEIAESAALRTSRVVYAFLCIFFIGYLIILFAKMAIVTFFILLLVFIYWQLISCKKYTLTSILTVIIIFGCVYFSVLNSKGREMTSRILSFKEFDWANYDARIVNSLNLRFIKWTCSAEVLSADNNWLWGAGTGDTKKLLNACYSRTLGEESFFVKENFNSHNNYFTVWLHLGLLPFLLFALHFVLLLIKNVKDRNRLGLIFTIGVALLCVTESVFEVQKGIVFYSFFQSLLILSWNASDGKQLMV